jgi:TRAP-type mannitol/chloroaromatic compound transport system permease small subunit
VDLFGLHFFNARLLFTWLTRTILLYPSWSLMEHSMNPSGLARYPIKLIMPFGFFMLNLQGLSEMIKRIGALMRRMTLPVKDLHYEIPMQ